MIGRLLISLFVPALLSACATAPVDEVRQACQRNMENIAARLLPAFERLGYQPRTVIFIDNDLEDFRGRAAPASVLADSAPGGRVRLRPMLCTNDIMATVVLAHEMSHVALAHWGERNTGVHLSWEAPRTELEADALARKVLMESGASKEVVDFLGCRLGQCEVLPKGWKHKPVGTRGALPDTAPDPAP